MWTQPQTAEQIRYYSTHGGKRAKYRLVRWAVRIAWFALASVGVHAILMSNFSNFPGIQFLAVLVSIALVWASHSTLEETLKTYFYDRADDKDGDGDTNDEADSSFIIPGLLCIALVLADFYGARQFQYGNIREAEKTDWASLDARQLEKLKAQNGQYETAKQDIEKRYADREKSVAARWDAQIATLQKKASVYEEDRRWISAQISNFRKNREAAIAALAGKKADDLEALSARHNAAIEKIEGIHDRERQKGETFESAETARVFSEQAAAHRNSWILSLLLAILFVATSYAEVRINTKSGIFPIRHYTQLHAHGGFLEKLWQYLVVDVWERFSHNLLVKLHSRMAVRTLSDFDGHAIEHTAQIPITLPHRERHAWDSQKWQQPPAGQATLSSPEAIQQISKSEFSDDEKALVLHLSEKWKAVCEFDDSNDHIEAWETRRELLENHGIVGVLKPDGSVKTYRERISIGEMEKRHPIPKVRAFAPASVPSPSTSGVRMVATPAPVFELAPLVEADCPPLSDNVRQKELANAAPQVEPSKEPATIVADLDKWQARARQCHRRTHPKNHEARSQEAREANAKRRDAYLELLKIFGVETKKILEGDQVSDNDIDFSKPKKVDFAGQLGRADELLRFLGELKTEI